MTDTTATATAIQEALEARKPAMAKAYADYARRAFENLVERFGPALQGIYNSRQVHQYKAISRVVEVTERAPVNRKPLAHGINEAALEAWSNAQADAAVEAWSAKIEEKLAGCTEATVASASADLVAFTIHARLGDHGVTLRQAPVLKCSTRGLLYHQFPARIYVDGEFTPEAKFKALAAEVAG